MRRNTEDADVTRRSDAAIVYDGALTYQAASQEAQQKLIEEFEELIGGRVRELGELQLINEPDEQFWLKSDGTFYGRVIPEEGPQAGQWRELDAGSLTDFYDATDLFGKLADAVLMGTPQIETTSGGAWDEFLDDEAPSFTSTPRYSAMPGAEDDLIAEAEGSGGHIWVWSDRLRIKPFGIRGMFTKGVLKGDKDIWLDQISGIQWREPGLMWLGHIQFTLIGGSNDSKPPASDENAVQFTSSRRAEFAEVKLVVEERIRALRLQGRGAAGVSGPAPTTPALQSMPTVDTLDTLRRLGELRAAGVVTDAEFERKKADLLDRI